VRENCGGFVWCKVGVKIAKLAARVLQNVRLWMLACASCAVRVNVGILRLRFRLAQYDKEKTQINKLTFLFLARV